MLISCISSENPPGASEKELNIALCNELPEEDNGISNLFKSNANVNSFLSS